MSLRFFVGPFVILAFSWCVPAQTVSSDPTNIMAIKRSFDEERWLEVIRLAETTPNKTPDVNYYHGIALAKLERWDEARTVFQRGLIQNPADKRFFIELAGVSFRQKRISSAFDHLHGALKIDPTDGYANNFLASLYYLQGNIEASLKYWNRVSKPDLVEVRVEPTPGVDPVLLDRAFSFAPLSKLVLQDFQTTDARVKGLDVFNNYRFDLQARPDEKFDMVLRASERKGLESGGWRSLIPLLRGLPFQTIHPEIFNIGGRAMNFVSLIRWDSKKERIWANFSGPLSGDPKWRYGFAFDLRREEWDIRDSSTDRSQSRGSFNLRKQVIQAEIDSFASGRLTLSTGIEASDRGYDQVNVVDGSIPELQVEGFELKHLALAKYDLIRVPEKRLLITSSAATEFARIWSNPSYLFARLQLSVQTHWFPKAQGDDYEILLKTRAGGTIGRIPFDELFVLGLERDNSLWLRAHIGAYDGRKGSAPLGRNYFLANWEIDKNIYNDGLISFKLGPLLDIGRITDSSTRLGSGKWLWDLGVQTKIKILGVGVAVSYGKDLRSGANAFYVSTTR
jgi:hypothetical protein